MKSIYLVSCVKTKALFGTKAEDLYESNWFRKAKPYVLSRLTERDEWYILSAKYHLLLPQEMVDPYEQTLNRMSVAQRRSWSDKVLSQLMPRVERGDRVVFLAGQRYREFLFDQLSQSGCRVEVPMEGLGSGKQLTWLKERLSR